MDRIMAMEQDTHPHVHLWNTASFFLKSAEADDQNSDYFLIAALLMSYLAYESFVNSCGFILCPDLWRDERKNFGRAGIEGKLEAIADKLGDNFSWDKGASPYQEIKQLESFRDLAVHAKASIQRYEAERKDDGSHYRFEHEWDSFITLDRVRESRGHIETFCQSIVIASRKVSDHPRLVFDAFGGSGRMTTGKSILDPSRPSDIVS